MSDLVLVVDRDPMTQRLYRSKLQPLGCHVLACDDADLALDLVSTTQPDLVILDMHLPGKSGAQMAAEIKARHAEVPVLICSDCTCHCDDFAAWSADACVAKSSDLGDLLHEVMRLRALAPMSAAAALV